MTRSCWMMPPAHNEWVIVPTSSGHGIFHDLIIVILIIADQNKTPISATVTIEATPGIHCKWTCDLHDRRARLLEGYHNERTGLRH